MDRDFTASKGILFHFLIFHITLKIRFTRNTSDLCWFPLDFLFDSHSDWTTMIQPSQRALSGLTSEEYRRNISCIHWCGVEGKDYFIYLYLSGWHMAFLQYYGIGSTYFDLYNSSEILFYEELLSLCFLSCEVLPVGCSG